MITTSWTETFDVRVRLQVHFKTKRHHNHFGRCRPKPLNLFVVWESHIWQYFIENMYVHIPVLIAQEIDQNIKRSCVSNCCMILGGVLRILYCRCLIRAKGIQSVQAHQSRPILSDLYHHLPSRKPLHLPHELHRLPDTCRSVHQTTFRVNASNLI